MILSVHGRLSRRILIENRNNKIQGDSLHLKNLKIVKFERAKLLLGKLGRFQISLDIFIVIQRYLVTNNIKFIVYDSQ